MKKILKVLLIGSVFSFVFLIGRARANSIPEYNNKIRVKQQVCGSYDKNIADIFGNGSKDSQGLTYDNSRLFLYHGVRLAEGDFKTGIGAVLNFVYDPYEAPQFHVNGNAEISGDFKNSFYQFPDRLFSGKYCNSNGENCAEFNCRNYPESYVIGGEDDCMVFAIGSYPLTWDQYQIYHFMTVAEPVIEMQSSNPEVIACEGLTCLAKNQGQATITAKIHDTQGYALFRLLANENYCGSGYRCSEWGFKEASGGNFSCKKWEACEATDWKDVWGKNQEGEPSFRQELVNCPGLELGEWVIEVGEPITPACAIFSASACAGGNTQLIARINPAKSDPNINSLSWGCIGGASCGGGSCQKGEACWNEGGEDTKFNFQITGVKALENEAIARVELKINENGPTCDIGVNLKTPDCRFKISALGADLNNLKLGDRIKLELNQECITGFGKYRVTAYYNGTGIDILNNNDFLECEGACSGKDRVIAVRKAGWYRFDVEALGTDGGMIRSCGSESVTINK